MNVLLADDHAIFREGFAHVVRAILPGCGLVEAGSFPQALRQLDAGSPIDLMIVDLRMPGMDGFRGIAALKARRSATPIAVLTASEDRDDMLGSLESGAAAFIPKTSGREAVATAIRVILGGGVWLPREDFATPASPAPPIKALTPRQIEVAALVRDGCANKEIAWRLGLSEGTVKAHLSAIMRVLGVRNRVLLVRRMEELGLL